MYILNVVVDGLEEMVNRKIYVDGRMNLSVFCECVILSMRGKKLYNYYIDTDECEYFISNMDSPEDSLYNMSLNDLSLKKGKNFEIIYDSYAFLVSVEKIIKDDDMNSEFSVLSGNGYGILDNNNDRHIISMINISNNDSRRKHYLSKSETEYVSNFNNFDVDEVNLMIYDYLNRKMLSSVPCNYILNISLKEYSKEIKRKVRVNNNILLRDFCEDVILSMNGDLSHCYCIKIGENYLEDDYLCVELSFLHLEKGKKFRIMYDYGDSWEFEVRVSSINDGYLDKAFEVISGKGYGIIEDCGGIYGLYLAFSGEHDYIEKVDINEFDLDECNKNVNGD